MRPIHKFNNGRGAMICNICRKIISVGTPTNVLLCNKCQNEKIKRELSLYVIILLLFFSIITVKILT